VSIFPDRIISFPGLTVAIDLRAMLMSSAGVNRIRQLHGFSFNVFATIFGFATLTRRAEGNRCMKCSITFVKGLHVDSSSGNVV